MLVNNFICVLSNSSFFLFCKLGLIIIIKFKNPKIPFTMSDGTLLPWHPSRGKNKLLLLSSAKLRKKLKPLSLKRGRLPPSMITNTSINERGNGAIVLQQMEQQVNNMLSSCRNNNNSCRILDAECGIFKTTPAYAVLPIKRDKQSRFIKVLPFQDLSKATKQDNDDQSKSTIFVTAGACDSSIRNTTLSDDDDNSCVSSLTEDLKSCQISNSKVSFYSHTKSKLSKRECFIVVKHTPPRVGAPVSLTGGGLKGQESSACSDDENTYVSIHSKYSSPKTASLTSESAAGSVSSSSSVVARFESDLTHSNSCDMLDTHTLTTGGGVAADLPWVPPHSMNGNISDKTDLYFQWRDIRDLHTLAGHEGRGKQVMLVKRQTVAREAFEKYSASSRGRGGSKSRSKPQLAIQAFTAL